MKLKNMFGVALAALMGACILLPSNVQAQKKKKEKKAYEWKWDGELSGNETVDGYLLSCDTLWTEIQSYRKDIDQFDYVEDTLTIHDKTYLVVHLERHLGKIGNLPELAGDGQNQPILRCLLHPGGKRQEASFLIAASKAQQPGNPAAF